MRFRIEMEENEGDASSSTSNASSSSAYQSATEGKSNDTIKACSKTIEHFNEVLSDLNKKLDFDSSNDKAIRHCEPERQKLKEEMFEQLKDVGNSLLGRFGMKVEYLKAVEDSNTEMQTKENKMVISPNKEPILRRKTNKWRIDEVETLKMGVNKYGKGNWKAILNSHREIFQERTEVDLKDKWRNLTKHETSNQN